MIKSSLLITVKGGNGGNGCVSYYTNRRISKGGPDGGNGGNGGNVVFKGSSQMRTLEYYHYARHIKAQPGEDGSSQNRHGKNADDTVCIVPLGTQIWTEDEAELLADINEEGQCYIAAKGGSGGYGNSYFRNASNQTPDYSKPGEIVTECKVYLKLKMIADVGLIGFPNAGKSSFLRNVSNSKTKVAPYPFTTLYPELGTITYHDQQIIFADIPGLIEGAHEGKGLGHEFLAHIERCKILFHLIDITTDNPMQAYKQIRYELEQHSDILLNKPEIVLLTKSDLLSTDECQVKCEQLSKQLSQQVFYVSNFQDCMSANFMKAMWDELS